MRPARMGFTIVELLIVIIVIAILAALTVVGYSGISQKAVVSSLKADLTNNAKKLMLYRTQYGSYPTGIDSLTGCPTGPTASSDPTYCLKYSTSNTLSSYTGDNNTFSLKIQNSTVAYVITESTAPTASNAISVSGGVLTSDATYYYRTFLTSGTFVVSGINLTADVLVIAGGGGSGSSGGGGGAGGVKTLSAQSFVSNTNYAVTVGAGGVRGTPTTLPTNGGDSSIIGGSISLASNGGGYGGGYNPVNGYFNAGNGSSGGGASWYSGTTAGTGISLQGYNGSIGAQGTGGADQRNGGGGGGSGAAAISGSASIPGKGGAGTNAYSSWLSAVSSALPSATQSAVSGGYIAGGGSGAANYTVSISSSTPGGLGGGGNGGGGPDPGSTGGFTATDGIVNTGSGGGSGVYYQFGAYYGQNGGSGVVIIRYTRAQVGG